MPRILIVDDQEICRAPLGRLLTARGFLVQMATGAAEALEMLPGFGPKVVILDLNMPLMDGYQFLKAARLREEWPTYDVVIYTADQNADIERLLALGAARVCEKAPGGLDCLLEAVRTRLAQLPRLPRTQLI